MMQLLLDPWSSDYPASVQANGDEAVGADVQIDTSIETAQWSAILPTQPPDSAAFVDGVRRLEARVVGLRPEGTVYGLFASFATGATAVVARNADFIECRTGRTLVLTSGLNLTEQLQIGNANLVFTGKSVSAGDPDSLLLAVQSAMREAEWALAGRLPSQVVFLDGPLAYVTEPPRRLLGVVKTIQRLYLSNGQMGLTLQLRVGERTPVFAISEGRKARYSWYLRIADRRPIHHGFSGVIRLEASAAGGIDNAVVLAGMSAAYLPQFASSPHRDPRAPHNLTPVGALEQHLRNQMGDATLIQRAIEMRVSKGITI